ncbi:MAG: ATP-binding protein, partial [Bacteroidetes bacterium]|nr:ATP-binding protein [Bacteroidota bacterium]
MKPTPLPINQKTLSKKIATKKVTTRKAVTKEIQTKKTSIPPKNNDALNLFTVVAIGASAGGLEAITHLLQSLSPTTGMAFIYVQHLSPDHKSILSELLSKTTKMKVQDIEDMEKMEPNNVYVIPYNKAIEVTDGHIKLLPRPSKSYILSIDILFSSLAETHKENVIGIVLSGSANDGTQGLKEIKTAGGITFAQDDSAKYSSMPKSAIAAGVVDFILSPKEIGKKINWMSKHPFIKRNGVKHLAEDEIDNNNLDLKFILQYVYKKKNVDFSYYKMNTIKRRILRRMVIHKIATLKQYAKYLEEEGNEVNLLYKDLLINVTEFFRDPEAFILLKKIVLPRLLKSKTLGETLRIWVAACATGEEVYSIAMLLFEIQDNNIKTIPFQIFASDLSEEAIAEARIGEYSTEQLKNVSPKRLQRFFTKVKDKYRVSKSLRDVCIFAPHNILSDPPFSRLDLISCRNLLIYLEPPAQKKALATFHYALNDNGCLMLGKSETIGSSAHLFTTSINNKCKIYTRKNNSVTNRLTDITPRILQEKSIQKSINTIPKKFSASTNGNLSSAFDSFLLAQYMPASVVINTDLEILQFRGATALYLQNASGKASLNVLKMAHIEITFELRNAIHHAIKTKTTVRKTGIEMNRDKPENLLRIVNLEVSPLKIEGEDDLLVIVFTGEQQKEVAEHTIQTGKTNSVAKDRRIKKLEEEIAAARFDMASITQDQEAANEELQSANEEIVSSNEELQSLNEELETSKEEIESTNEELITTNHELQTRIQQVEELYDYNQIILDTIHEPMLILDKNIRIKSANKSFCKTFHVSEEESIGISLYKLGNNQWNIPQLRELIEEIVPKKNSFSNFEVKHTFPVIGTKIMWLNAHRIVQKSNNDELIVLSIIDITDTRKLALALQEKEKKELEVRLEEKRTALKSIEESEKKYRNLLTSIDQGFTLCEIIRNKEGKAIDFYILEVNPTYEEQTGLSKETVLGKRIIQTFPSLTNWLETYAAVVDNQCPVFIENYFEDTNRWFENKAYPVGKDKFAVLFRDITERKHYESKLIEAKESAENAAKSKQQFLSNMSHEIRTPMNAIIGFTNVLLKTNLDESQNEYLNAIKISGDALIVLINDILDLAKVNSGKMTFEQTEFDLHYSITTILQLFNQKVKENNVELIIDYDNNIPAVLLGDPLRLRQILLNLLSNAIKFTKEGSITICVKIVNEDAEKIRIEFSLCDTGIGIPTNKLKNIFNSFEQASQETSRSYGGSGLGLAIVKQLVELQSGNIDVTSKVGKGSTFVFTLSFLKVNAIAIQQAEQEQKLIQDETTIKPLTKTIKVLVAEDVALNQLLIKIILMDFGFEFDIAENGKIAIELL